MVFEEHLPRSLHAWSQPTPLWLGTITHPHHQLSSFQTSELCLATVGFHLGSPEGTVQFQFDTSESTPETKVVWTACTGCWFFILFPFTAFPIPSSFTVGEKSRQRLMSGCWREQWGWEAADLVSMSWTRWKPGQCKTFYLLFETKIWLSLNGLVDGIFCLICCSILSTPHVTRLGTTFRRSSVCMGHMGLQSWRNANIKAETHLQEQSKNGNWKMWVWSLFFARIYR